MCYKEDTNKPAELCKVCHDEEVYSSMTGGMCLNCYQNDIIENRQADIEAEHDYYDGFMPM